MMFGQQMTGSLRLMIIVTFAVAMAVASFAHSFAVMLGIAAVFAAGGFAIIMVTGAVISLGQDKTTDETLPASIRLSNEDFR
jgi:hypothetical protein